HAHALASFAWSFVTRATTSVSRSCSPVTWYRSPRPVRASRFFGSLANTSWNICRAWPSVRSRSGAGRFGSFATASTHILAYSTLVLAPTGAVFFSTSSGGSATKTELLTVEAGGGGGGGGGNGFGGVVVVVHPTRPASTPVSAHFQRPSMAPPQNEAGG